ncbi:MULTISPECIES: hypothetical protein [Clostridium]|uniref:Uncharacterized protein n=1 Tax=Clostridium faecium TaxID=2762223 RepID=A0ABR8YRL7_9CLOT|nr:MULTISPECIES: hypothetical protein [Clostridium]MBD8046782.1 hypothetical protein [Clostridium faecium]
MHTLMGVVNKPQFDTDIFKTGQAIHIRQKASNGFELLNVDGIISEVNPLFMIVMYYSKRDLEMIDIKIYIDDVTSGELKITLLKEEI